MIVVSGSHGKHLGKKIAEKLNAKHSELKTDKFPDGELGVRFNAEIKGKKVVFVQSFYDEISDCIVESILAGATAKNLGARKLILVAPYFPYMRQDKKFNPGEAISQKIMGKLFDNYFDAVYIMDPHLHRTKSLKQIFKIKSVNLESMKPVAEYVKKNIKNPVIIGPDSESYQWAEEVAEIAGAEATIFRKKRYGDYNVKVTLEHDIDLKNKTPVLIDDIVSTGHTIIEAAKILRKLGAKNIYCIATHGIFVKDAVNKLKKARIEIVSTNTIPNKVSKIDISGVISESLKSL